MVLSDIINYFAENSTWKNLKNLWLEYINPITPGKIRELQSLVYENLGRKVSDEFIISLLKIELKDFSSIKKFGIANFDKIKDSYPQYKFFHEKENYHELLKFIFASIDYLEENIEEVFNFQDLQRSIKNKSYEEKLIILIDSKAKYSMLVPDFLFGGTNLSFDKLCEIEIDRLQKVQDIKRSNPTNYRNLNSQSSRKKKIKLFNDVIEKIRMEFTNKNNESLKKNPNRKPVKNENLIFKLSQEQRNELISELCPYFTGNETALEKLFNGETLDEPLLFQSKLNILVELFRRLRYNKFLHNDPSEINKWLCQNFTYLKKTNPNKGVRPLVQSSVKSCLYGKNSPNKNDRICDFNWLPFKTPEKLKKESENP